MKFEGEKKKFLVDYLIKNLNKCVSSQETTRMTVLFFVVSGLDLVNSLDEISDERKKEIIEWIYQHQLHPNDDDSNYKKGKFGFGTIMPSQSDMKYDYCNLAITYCALVSLIILGDDLNRVNRKVIIRGLKEHQRFDGRFVQALIEEEDDLRMTYCASTICFILNDWSSVDKDNMISFIKSCQSYEKGFGQIPNTEAHGGSTFCAIASLYLMGQLSKVFTEEQKKDIAEWCLQRQITGFQGRPNKDPDTCYSFWVGATLTLLNYFQFQNHEFNHEFLKSTYDSDCGGFGKYPGNLSDLMHTYFGLGALSLRVYNNIDSDSEPETIQSMFPALNISQRAYKHLKSIQENWY